MTPVSGVHTSLKPSPWVKRWAHILKPQSRVLDVACGNGRHSVYLANLGHAVKGVDKAPQILPTSLLCDGTTGSIDIETVNLELQDIWPLGTDQFDAIVVTNYLWRPHWPHLLRNLAPEGVLIAETFAVGNEQYGRPSNPQFLLQSGELLHMTRDLSVVAYEHGLLDEPKRVVQRVAAYRPSTWPNGLARRLYSTLQ
jgi:SAM-dependent methyltransferase